MTKQEMVKTVSILRNNIKNHTKTLQDMQQACDFGSREVLSYAEWVTNTKREPNEWHYTSYAKYIKRQHSDVLMAAHTQAYIEYCQKIIAAYEIKESGYTLLVKNAITSMYHFND